ncbi:hypothetical protein HAPAU_16220 [Halalkalicoccus paucihalophilus]|uniref:Uncharacterized protein n=2 Tax=Halalkalicoccus paucihalophilus TaxID=1008153 RepID=A0A151AFY0_9EURY|nr:hypothetical protein HAPAU_16220 [Halalkalicoccus paucihalophilus]
MPVFSYVTDAMVQSNVPQPTAERQRELASTLGVGGPTTGERLTVDRLREEIDADPDDSFVSMGEAIRNDLSGRLDADLLAAALPEIVAQVGRVPEVREAGIPGGKTGPEALYRGLVEPAWRVYHHLEDVGFFESVEANLPAFTPEHIAGTARELVRAEPLSTTLEECGFDERERMVLMMNVANNDTRLSRWTPTREIPEGVEFEVEYVPPLQQRAMGGALLWVQALDEHLWRKEILITDAILDDVRWDTKAMLGGLYLMALAAHDIAAGADGSLTDAQLTAALTAGTAVTIVNQEELMQDAFWITEEKRKPSEASGREEELPWQ